MRLRPYIGIVLAVLVFAGSLTYLAGGIRVGTGGGDTPPFHIDEAHKLGETFYYHLFVEKRQWDHPAWTEDFYARTNPPVAKYIFGAVLAAAGHHVHDQQLQDDFERHWRSPKALRKRVPDGMLRVTRGTSAVFGALVCMLLFVIGRRAGGVAAGLIASVLLLANPYFQRIAQRGLTDSVLMFFLLLIVPVSLGSVAALRRYWNENSASSLARRVALLMLAMVIGPGLVIALATGSKLNGALTGPTHAVGVVLAVLVGFRSGPAWRRLGLALLVTCLAVILAGAIFVAINPWFHDHAVARATGTLAVYDDWMVKQKIDPGGGLFGLHQKITAAGYFALFSPVLPLARPLGQLGIWLGVLGFVVGAVWLAGQCAAKPRAEDGAREGGLDKTRARTHRVVIGCWLVLCLVVVIAWLPVAWHRYLLVPYLTVCLTTGIGLANLPRAGKSAADAIAGKLSGRTQYGVLAGSTVVAALWIGLAFTPWLIVPGLLDPTVFPEAHPARGCKAYAADVDAHPDSVLLRRHLGLALLRQKQPKTAAEQFETALGLLDRDRTNRPGEAVQRACLLYDLARASAAMGHRSAAIDAVRRHVAAVEGLRDQMTSADPKVREAFDQVIASRRQWASRATQTRPNRSERPGPPR